MVLDAIIANDRIHSRSSTVKFNTVINSVIIIVAALFLTALAFRVNAGTTTDAIAVLKTAGMTCSSCSVKVSTVLQSQRGVSATEVDIEGGWVVVGYDTKLVKPEQLAERVSSTGFVSTVHQVLTPDQFKQISGRSLGKAKGTCSGCCKG
jgi:copper chaperone CopZ